MLMPNEQREGGRNKGIELSEAGGEDIRGVRGRNNFLSTVAVHTDIVEQNVCVDLTMN